MICCLDVDYKESRGRCAAVLFRDWEDVAPVKTYSHVTDPVAPYEPGFFYKRELPCMLNTLCGVAEDISVLVIDGYVWLGENRGGLGYHLYETLERRIPVIGVAKTAFRGAEAVALPVLRGKSDNPLWVTAIGMNVRDASLFIQKMAGTYRLPTLIKLADTECRQW